MNLHPQSSKIVLEVEVVLAPPAKQDDGPTVSSGQFLTKAKERSDSHASGNDNSSSRLGRLHKRRPERAQAVDAPT
jgi:hypothetical protein